MSVIMQKKELEGLLDKTSRLAIINGKLLPQVEGCVLQCDGESIKTTSIVKDGRTSVALFSAPLVSSEIDSVVVSNITVFKNALSVHNGMVNLVRLDNKIRIQSNNKQTTIISDARAPAFPHSQKTIKEWVEESEIRMGSVSEDGAYTTNCGTVVEPLASYDVDAQELREGILSGNINGQKVARYTFTFDKQNLYVSVGQSLKGETRTLLHTDPLNDETPSSKTCFEGGIENTLKTVKGLVKIHFLDFSDFGGGISVIYAFDGGLVFQRECVNAG